MSRYSIEELSDLTLKSLVEIGAELRLTFHNKQNKAKRVSMILAKYAERDAAVAKRKLARKSPPAKDADTSGNIPPSADSASPLLGERKPAFEGLCNGPADGNPAEHVEAQDRGGVRPGAGRPDGMTDQIALYNRLPQQPHPVIKDSLELLWKTWATRAHCPEIQLSKEQAFELALPFTQLAEICGVTRFIPAWTSVCIACVWTSWNMVSVSAEKGRVALAERKAVKSETAEVSL